MQTTQQTQETTAPTANPNVRSAGGLTVIIFLVGVWLALEATPHSGAYFGTAVGIGVLMMILSFGVFMGEIGWHNLPYVLGSFMILGGIGGVAAFNPADNRPGSFTGLCISLAVGLAGGLLLNRRMTIDLRKRDGR
ncbi:MAG TPA: hypothetical protein VMR98_02310, partial [Candidatus Polarisedimenticolaceae bacterium]|nr:hypothetical protein [Candidatus Polarisedimenticolaceae bacterium]